jgi:SAM-dependent methyltransferase
LRCYAEWAQNEFHLDSSSLVVDIGSNDGTCLSFFKELGSKVVGVDPATLPAQIANDNGIPTLNSFFDSNVVQQIISTYGHADLITSHNALAHIDDIQDVFSNIHTLLKPNANFIFEIGYFRSVLENQIFDTTYHEHLDYHHASPLINLLLSIGFSVVSASTNNVQGGSLRLWLKRSEHPSISDTAQRFLDNEKLSILYDQKDLNSWTQNIYSSMSDFGELVRSYSASSKQIAGYGVPTKATLLLSLSGLSSSDIKYCVEDNPLKVNRFVPGLGIPILSLDTLFQDKPDVVLIFAWNFADDIVSKLRSTVDWPLLCIVPLPTCLQIQL